MTFTFKEARLSCGLGAVRKSGASLVTVGNLPYLEDWRNEVGPEL